MAYELFQRTNTRVDAPTISIVPNGRIVLNAAAVRILVAGGVKFVLLLWDRENRRLAIKSVNKGDKNAFAVSIVRNSSARLGSKSFLAHIGWNAPRRETMAASWDAQEKMFEVTLPLKCFRPEKSNDHPDEQELTAAEEQEIERYLMGSRLGTIALTVEQLFKTFAMQHTVRYPQKTREFMKSFFARNKHAVKKERTRSGETAYLWKRGS
jgi:hypothetical protein